MSVGLALVAEARWRLEWIRAARSATTGPIEFGIGILRDDRDGTEWLAQGMLGVLGGNALAVLESLTSGVRISTAELLLVEWADSPGLMLVSPQRLLCSPGSIRILAGPDSNHPLRRQ